MFTFCPNCQSTDIKFIDNHQFNCQSCTFTYYHNVAASCAAIITCGEQILLTERAKNPGKGLLDLPGGFVDPHESLEQALTREVLEELNITIDKWQFVTGLPNTYRYKDVTYSTMDCVFSCQLEAKPRITLQQSEIASYQWLDLQSLDISLLAFDSLREALNKYKENLQ